MKSKNIWFVLCLFGCATPSSKPQASFNDLAMPYLNEYKADCVKEGGDTWGKSLCVPMIVLNRESMQALTTEPDPKGKFQKIGNAYMGAYYGEPVYANTSIQWGGGGGEPGPWFCGHCLRTASSEAS